MSTSSRYPCNACECREFVSNPWKEYICINCYHPHGPILPSSVPNKTRTIYTSKEQLASLTSGSSTQNSATTSPVFKNRTIYAPQFSKSSPTLPNNDNRESRAVTNQEPPPKPNRSLPSPPVRGSAPVAKAISPGNISRASLPNKENVTMSNNEDLLKKSTAALAKMNSIANLSYREKIVRELVETEQTYLKNLNILIEEYMTPLKKDSRGGRNISDIFNNIEEIRNINSILLQNLQERIQNWSNASSKIGDIFLEVGPYFKPYYTKYTEHYAHAQRILVECEKSQAFLTFLEETQLRPEIGQSIRALLILPIQRIPRYNLLLAELVKHTTSTHLDYEPLSTCFEKMKNIANAINTAIKQGENRQKIIKIQDSFINTNGNNLVEPHRVYIRDGPLMKVCRKSLKQRWFFLFNDIIVYGSVIEGGGILSNNKYIWHGLFNLSQVRIEDIGDSAERKYGFQVVNPIKSFIVHASSHEEKVEWMIDICTAIEELKQKRATFTGTKDVNNPGVEAPVWVPDNQVKTCFLCNEAFTFTKRRHHCRACGACVCANCSPHKLILTNLGKDKVRVCDQCHSELANSQM